MVRAKKKHLKRYVGNGGGDKYSNDVNSYVDPETGLVWRKVLYERGKFPDNYTPDQCFLAAIERNKNLHKYTFQQCLLGSSQVALQMSVVILFAISYISLDSGTLSCDVILALVATSSLLGYLGLHLFVISRPITSLATMFKDLQHVAIFLSFGLGLSPVLYKLTDTISTDTIHTTSGLMLFVHLIFHNYGLEGAAVVSNPLSLNAALFASVSLASRLSSSFDAFVLLALSVEAFVLFPIFRLKLTGRLLLGVTAITSLAVVVLTAKYYAVSASLCTAFAFILVTIICPSLFIHWQSHKYTIHGPWDEAVPNIM